MRVLQVCRDYFDTLPGGIERHVTDLAEGLGEGFDVEVLVAGRRRRAAVQSLRGVKVHKAAEYFRVQGIPACPGFFSAMRQGWDIVHVHSPNPLAELALRSAPGSTKKVATFHADAARGGPFRKAYDAYARQLLSRADRVIATSPQVVQSSPVLSRLERERPGFVHIVPLGVDLERFTPGATPASQELRQSWGPGPIVLFVGRLAYYKGLPDLIEAMRELDARLVVVGNGLQLDQVLRLGVTLGDRFLHVPFAAEEDLADYYRAADVFCLPSSSSAEAFGIAIAEAMACGVPAVTTEVGTATSVVNRDGETGAVVEPRDPWGLRAAIEKLVSDDHRRREMGEAARARVEAHYPRAKMLELVEAVYGGLRA